MEREYNYILEWDIDGTVTKFINTQTFIDENIHVEARTQGRCDVIESKETYSTPSSIDLMNKKYNVEVLAIYDAESGVDFKKIMVSNYYNEIAGDYQHKILNWYKKVM